MATAYLERLAHLQRQLPAHTGWLLTNPTDILYYTGFVSLVPGERDAVLLISPEVIGLMHAAFSPIHTPLGITRLAGCSPTRVVEHLATLRRTHRIDSVWIDSHSLFVAEHQELQKSGLPLSEGQSALIWKQRMIKDADELAALSAAGKIANQVLSEVKQLLRVGMTELEVGRELAVRLRQAGATQEAFPTIVAFGAHSALPHHQPTATALTAETAVLLDFGVMVDNYCSDMTRSFWFGTKPTPEYQKISGLVNAAYDASLRRAQSRPCTVAEVDLAARQLITDAGYGEYFIHTTGHGIGLNIHEPPSVSSRSTSLLENGLIITIEPGIYLEGQFGVRYENTIEITATGAKSLTS